MGGEDASRWSQDLLLWCSQGIDDLEGQGPPTSVTSDAEQVWVGGVDFAVQGSINTFPSNPSIKPGSLLCRVSRISGTPLCRVSGGVSPHHPTSDKERTSVTPADWWFISREG